MNWGQLITDPSSGQLSMSRLLYGVIVLSLIGGAITFGWMHKVAEATDLLKTALITTAGIYASNSVAGAIVRKGTPPETENKPESGD